MSQLQDTEALYNDTIKNSKNYLAMELNHALKSIYKNIIENSGENKEDNLREFDAALGSSWEKALYLKSNKNNIEGVTKDMAWSLMCILSNQKDDIFRGEDAIKRNGM